MKKKKSLRTLLAGILAIAMLLCVVAVACAPSDDGSRTEGPETGIYYNDEGETDYTMNLFGGNRFTLFIEGTTKYGNYSLNGETLSLLSSDEETYSAQLSNDTIVLEYNSAQITFLKMIDYRVEFSANGGSAVEGKTVTNGKTLSKPQDPVREGYAFLGWYSDDSFTTPFLFDGERITGNTTLYARWGARPVGVAEYTVKFDWNLSSLQNPASATTVGGKLYTLPQAPEAEGYRFDGWWVSMSNKADKLSFRYTDDYLFGENTTLFALWQSTASSSKLAAPLVSVGEKSISWNGATGVTEYRVEVKNAKTGALIYETNTGATTLSGVDFATLPAGDYQVSVTAIASDSANNSEPAVRYYKNKALKRVSVSEIAEPAIFVFRGVENATEYELNVVCGNKNHVHSAFNNGSSTNFNLSNCDMKAGGITITVTAKANGYASSVSETFVYNRELKPIDRLNYDGSEQKIVWNAVEKATNYFVSVNGGDYVDVGGATSFSLKEYDAQNGKLEVRVYPATKGYNSPAASQITCEKSGLSAPKNLRLSDGDTLAWDEVTGATSYEVRIGGTTRTAEGLSMKLTEQFNLAEGESYEVTVKAKGDGESLWSSAYTVNYRTLNGALNYFNGTLNWTPVLGADSMEVRVNDGEFEPLDTYASSAAVTLTKGGYNTLYVRFVKNGVASRALSMQVYAYTITFNSQLGTAVPTQYKAMGDTIELAQADKANYDFKGWYNIPGGAAGNGALFDGTFTATGDLTLYAYYLPKSFTITYSFGRHGSGSEPTKQVKYREYYTLEVPVTSQGTQMFDGWFTGENGTGARLTDANGVSVNAWMTPGNATVYAHWIDDALRFELTKVSGSREDVYRVSQGSNIQDEVTIPATYNGLPVAMIGADAFVSTRAKVINIPDTMRVISGAAFATSDYLCEVNVYHVEGNNAIRYWSDEGVLYDYGALDDQPEDTSWLTSTLQFCPRGKVSDNYVIPDRVVTIASGAFERCDDLIAVTVPSSVTYVAGQAFSSCESLETIDFKYARKGEQVQELTISNSAFFQCDELKTVNLPARLRSISVNRYVIGRRESGSPAAYSVGTSYTDGVTDSFYMCSSLEAINVEEGGNYYSSQDGVLYNANQSTLLYFPEGKIPVYQDPTDETAPAVNKKFVIPSTVTKIGNGAFLGTRNIEELVIPNMVTEIGECAFYGCSSYYGGITSVVFEGDSLSDPMTIGRYAFRGCEDMETLTFEAGCNVGTIGEGAFMGCAIDTLTVPSSMTKIGDQAFRDCEYLEEITFEESRNELSFGDFVFSGCESLTSISLPKNATSVPSFGGIAIETITIADGNPYLTTENGVVFDTDKTILYFYPQGKTDTSYTIPDTVTKIAPSAFQNAANLSSVTIGANVTEIGESAFANCGSLTQITMDNGDGTHDLTIGKNAFFGAAAEALTIPARVTEIGAYAFAEMNNLAEFTLNAHITEIPEGMLRGAAITSFTVKDYVTSIGAMAFAGYTVDAYRPTDAQLAAAMGKLEQITFEGTSQLTYIGEGAFYNTKLTSVTLPDSVETIDSQAFTAYAGYDYSSKQYKFSSLLTQVTINETSKLKTIGSYAFAYTKITTFFVPKTVERIRAGAFELCTQLGSITFDQTGEKDLFIGEYETYISDSGYDSDMYGDVFAGTALTRVDFPARLKELGGASFDSCTLLETVTFAPAGQESRLMYIAEELFVDCKSLKTVTIPKSVGDQSPVGDQSRYAIGENAFQNCVSLESVITEAGNENEFTIYNYAFGDDENLTELTEFTFPKGLVEVGRNAFACCPNIQKFFVDGDSNAVYGSYDGVLYTPDFVEVVLVPAAREGKVTLHDNAQVIGGTAFKGCTMVTEVQIPATMKEFDAGTLSECTMLEKVSVKGEGLYKEIDGILYNGDGTELLYCPVTLFDGTTKYALELPETVRKIAPRAFYNATGLKSVSFANVTQDLEIGEYAFYGCEGLTELHLPQSLTKMGESVFENCSNLQTLTFVDGCKLEALPDFAFVNCSALTAIRISAQVTAIPGLTSKTSNGSTLRAGIFHGCTGLETITFETGSLCEKIGSYGFETNAEFYSSGSVSEMPDGENIIGTIDLPQSVSIIGEYAFYGCEALTSIELPSDLLEISNGMFFLCKGLKSVNIPAGVSAIGNRAFYNCQSLTALKLPNTVVSIGYSAFHGCSDLGSINIPASVNEFLPSDSSSGDYGLFYQCVNLSEVDYQAKCTSLPDNIFRGCTALMQITLPETVQTFGNYCFQGTGLTTFKIPDSVVDIPRGLFTDCASLSSVTLHDSINSIGYETFKGTALTSISLPDSVISIGASAFQNCTQLGTVKLSSSLKALDYSTFQGCTSLGGITLPTGLTSIGYSCFQGSGLTSFTLPAGVTEIPQQMLYGCGSLETLTLHDNVTFIGNAAFANTGLTSFTLPAKVTSVPQQMLAGSGELRTLTLHANVTSLGGYAFANTGLREFTLPAGVTSIPDGYRDRYDSSAEPLGLLSGCTSLETVTLHNNCTYIGTYAFRGCTKLTTEKLTLGTGVKTIAAEAFAYCTGLTSFEIPASVTNYNSTALLGCTATLSVEEGSQSYCYENGVMYNADKSKILFFVGTLEEFTWETTTSVAAGAFSGVTLNSVTVKAGATVDSNAFKGASIKTLTVGDGAKLGSNSFDGGKLGTVTLGANVVIGSNAFQNTQAFSETEPMKVTFGDGSTAGSSSFKNSNVSSITLGQNVTLDYDSLWNCKSVATIFIPKGTKLPSSYVFEGWTSEQIINIEYSKEEVSENWSSGWKSLCDATINYGQTKPVTP